MTDKELNTMLEVIEEHDELCMVCRYHLDCHGLTQGPNGPICPPCADKGAGFDSGLFDENDIVEWYKDIVEGDD